METPPPTPPAASDRPPTKSVVPEPPDGEAHSGGSERQGLRSPTPPIATDPTASQLKENLKEEISFDDFKIGGSDLYGNRITDVIGTTDHVIVYMVEGGTLGICSPSEQPTEREVEILAVFRRLDSLITDGLQKSKAISLRYDLGGALYCALSENHSTRPVNECFADVSEQITTRALDSARFLYVVSGFATAALLLMILSLLLCAFYISPLERGGTIHAIILGLIGGIVGSAVSIFARSNTIEISPFKQNVFTLFQGSSRIFLGGLFGFVFVCCVKANILLSILSAKPTGLFAFSILAGFSETFVPELLKHMEIEAAKSPKPKIVGQPKSQKQPKKNGATTRKRN
jgi:hypothetical protein